MILFQKVVSELRFANAKSQNHRLNRVIQTILFNLVTSDRSSSQGLWAVKLTHELWRRRVWTDSKAVEIMKEASLADNEKVIIGGIRFFLGRDEEMDGVESSDEEDVVDVGKLKHRAGVTKKTKKKARTFEKAVATVKKVAILFHILCLEAEMTWLIRRTERACKKSTSESQLLGFASTT